MGEREQEKKKSCVVALTLSTNVCHYVLWEKKNFITSWVHHIGLLDKCTSAILRFLIV